CPPVKNPIDIVLVVCYHSIERRMITMKKRPFTRTELAEALRELEEEVIDYRSGGWIAYCTTCKAAVEVDDNPRIVQTAALAHARRRPAHQVIVGWRVLGRAYGVCIEP